jgi:serine/threonine-protein kinase
MRGSLRADHLMESPHFTSEMPELLLPARLAGRDRPLCSMDVIVPEPLMSPVVEGEIVAGKYRVERVLGVGGMGVVVSARHTTLDQVVAIKFLVANRFDSREEAVARFLDEARAAARIESDYVCRVFDVGTLPTGVPFMVMEHLEGRDLDEELVQRGQLDLVEAVDYVLQAADALAAAHQLGIVHRDIKPANLFLAVRPDGTRRVKVLDFGIARAGAGGGPRRPIDSGSLGTPAYMSPEQVRGAADVDARTDIWGLGAILYELVTGQMAFVGADVRAILDHVVSDDPCPMHALRRDVPPELEATVMRCLARDRDRRWPSAAAFARALSPYGSAGCFMQLASVQRELGSRSSISGARNSSAHSVQPMVASVRESIPTAPDLSEIRAREGIVQDWSKLRARKRTARVVVLGAGALMFVAATAAVALRVGQRPSSERGQGAAAAAPPPAESVLPGVASASPSAPASNMYSAGNSVQSARDSGARPIGPTRPAGHAAPKGSVNHLGDARD